MDDKLPKSMNEDPHVALHTPENQRPPSEKMRRIAERMRTDRDMVWHVVKQTKNPPRLYYHEKH